MKSPGLKFILPLGCLLTILLPASAQNISFSPDEIEWIGQKVFENECSAKEECLVSWNEGEDFLSLGIGHFIWYPEGKEGPFQETFPQFLEYLRASGEQFPAWLDSNPWDSREGFLSQKDSLRVAELREFLAATKPQQAAFIVRRLDEALPILLQSVPEEEQEQIATQFQRVAATPEGTFALIDYINFKGLGVLATERYQGRGWGLLQVLQEMSPDGPQPLTDFILTAERLLVERVQNSPPERNEEKWLPGWKNRVRSYLDK